MPFSDEAKAIHALGALLTGTEARLVAHALSDDESVTSAFAWVDPTRRREALALVSTAGIRRDRDRLTAVLHGIAGARSDVTRVEPVWTMPGHLAGTGALTTRLVSLVDGARSSVVCSTFNFQKSSGMWGALRAAVTRPGVTVRVYVDTAAGASGLGAADVAAWLTPAVVFATGEYGGRQVRNHAKFISVDHRFLVITSANFSWSAEYGNVEFGVLLDDPSLAEAVERQMLDAEEALYRKVA